MSRPRLVFVVILALSLLLLAIAFYFNFLPAPLQAPRVVRIEPANEAIEIAPTSPITLTFSAPMQRLETQNAITFMPRVAGNFAWRDDQTLVFTPRSRLPISRTLEIAISQNARSWLQHPLQNEFTSRFTTLTRPFVMSSTPALDAQFVYAPNEIKIEFNRAMDGNVLADSILVEPLPQQLARDVIGNTLTLRGFFEPRTQYKISLAPFAADKEFGIELGRDYAWEFTVTSQYPNFSILNRGRVLKFSADTPLEIPTQFTNVSRLDVALYPITRQEFESNANAPFETWHAFAPNTSPSVTSSVATNVEFDTHAQKKIELGIVEMGTYYLRIASPEGVGDAQLVLVE